VDVIIHCLDMNAQLLTETRHLLLETAERISVINGTGQHLLIESETLQCIYSERDVLVKYLL